MSASSRSVIGSSGSWSGARPASPGHDRPKLRMLGSLRVLQVPPRQDPTHVGGAGRHIPAALCRVAVAAMTLRPAPGFDVGLDNARTTEEIVSVARATERGGFGTIWIAEQHFYRGVFTIAAAAAEATSSVRIGFGILSPFIRHPASVAMELASLTERYGDRFALGYGVGHIGSSRLGTVPSNQVAGLRDAAIATRALLRGETAYNGARLSCRIPPVSIYLGSMGPQSLRMSGAHYDGALLGVMCSPTFIASRAEMIEAALAKAGRSRDDFSLGALVLTAVADNPAVARHAVRKSVAYYLAEIPDVSPRLVGTGVSRQDLLSVRAQVLEAKATGGLEAAAAVLPDDLVDLLAVAGAPDDVAERLAGLGDAGLDRVVAHHALDADATVALGAALAGRTPPTSHD
ncbi:MAG: LLM class flavin-dependent oxidoreductase [Acidimicrobiia bacterium]|nr:LLM class flavin-dependent oxidoreductase [Acidimicrobiia bacterium]